MEKPEVVVLIPHYNNPNGLIKSIESINESEPVDLLIVDDGSTDYFINETAIMSKNSNNLKIYFLYLEKNMGIEYALNAGLEQLSKLKYTFISRLDCGDLCVPNRFLIQKQYLKEHQDIGIVGSFVKFIDSSNKHIFDLKLPISHKEISKRMYLNCMFIHPTVMFRAEVLGKVGKYPTNYEAAEDYAYFFEILKHYKGANINQFLVECELNPNGISIKKRKRQIISRIRLIIKNFKLGVYPIYGLVRNLIIYLLPYNAIVLLKSKRK